VPFLDEEKYLSVLGDVLRPSYAARHHRSDSGDGDSRREGEGKAAAAANAAGQAAPPGAAARGMDAAMRAADLLSLHGVFDHLSQRAAIATGSAGRGSGSGSNRLTSEEQSRRAERSGLLQQRVADWSLSRLLRQRSEESDDDDETAGGAQAPSPGEVVHTFEVGS
jgi:hypothetical protein